MFNHSDKTKMGQNRFGRKNSLMIFSIQIIIDCFYNAHNKINVLSVIFVRYFVAIQFVYGESFVFAFLWFLYYEHRLQRFQQNNVHTLKLFVCSMKTVIVINIFKLYYYDNYYDCYYICDCWAYAIQKTIPSFHLFKAQYIIQDKTRPTGWNDESTFQQCHRQNVKPENHYLTPKTTLTWDGFGSCVRLLLG